MAVEVLLLATACMAILRSDVRRQDKALPPTATRDRSGKVLTASRHGTSGRPLGVGIIAAVAAPVGLALLLAGASLLSGRFNGGSVGPGIANIAPVLGLLAGSLGVADLVFASGAWNMRWWALPLGLALCLAHIVVAVVEFAVGVVATPIAVIGLLIVLYYLRLPRVRRAFGESS